MSSIEILKIVPLNFNMCQASVCSDNHRPAHAGPNQYTPDTEAHYHENYVFVGGFSLFSKIASYHITFRTFSFFSST